MSATPAPRNLAERAWGAIDERFHLSGLVEFLSHKEVPASHSIVWYYLGGLSLFLFVVQIGTGILLLMNYQVGENTSYESMKHPRRAACRSAGSSARSTAGRRTS